MDPRLLQYYNLELQHLREMGAEFAEQFPKIAARLGMNGLEVTDPYVERLIEGVGFLAARVHLKLDAEFPRFTQALLETSIRTTSRRRRRCWSRSARRTPNEPNLARGFTVPRGSTMHGVNGRATTPTACEFRTAQDVTLWPIEIVSASYFSYAPDLPLNALPVAQRIKGGLRIRLRTTAGLKFSQTVARSPDALSDRAQRRRQHAVRAVSRRRPRRARARRQGRRRAGTSCCPRASIQPVGFADSEALLPVTLRSFQGYRLLQEYFSFPQRFRFFEMSGLQRAIAPRRRATSSSSCCCSAAATPRSRPSSTRRTSRCSARRRSTCFRSAPIAST